MRGAELVHRHHDGTEWEPETDYGQMPWSALEWLWHAHEHTPDHVDTTYLELEDGTGHPPDVTVRLTDELQAEVSRQMAAFKKELAALTKTAAVQ